MADDGFNPNPHPPAGAVHSDGSPIAGTIPEGGSDAGAPSFDKAWFDKELAEARQEAAKYRTSWAPYRDAFQPYNDDERQEWIDLAQLLATDPAAAEVRFREIADNIATAQGRTAAQQAATFEPSTPAGGQQAPAVDPADRPLTVREWQQLQAQYEAQRQSKEAEEEQLYDIYAQASELGYESGTKEIVDLFWYARNKTGGDFKAADALIKQEREQTVRSYLGEKGYDGRQLPVLVNGGTAPAGGQEPKDFASARASLEARLSQL